MDIDKLFKVPKLPPSGNKRRLPDNPTPETFKRLKMGTASEILEIPSSDRGSNQNGQTRRATVKDVDEDLDEKMEPDFAPGRDADYFAEDDEEGRFFGGGLTSAQKEILNIFEKADGEGAQEDLEEMNIASIRKLLLRFERAINKNQDQRSKYADDPSKFIDSEADLDIAIKSLLPLAQVPTVAYPELVRADGIPRLIGLLSHENVDIVIDVVEVIHELTDEDVGNENDDDGDSSREEAIKTLVEGLLENSVLELLVENLSRLNEAEESDRQGVFHVLGIFENILGFRAGLSTDLVAMTTILDWLVKRIHFKTHDGNRGYAAELLSILLQNNRSNRLQLVKKDGVETMLKVLSIYRRRDPVDADEAEFMQNVFDSLCSALAEPEVKTAFLDCEGVDLMIIMMKERMKSRSRSIEVLDYAMSGTIGTAACETFVEALGLRILFAAFMGKQSNKQKIGAVSPTSEDTSHTLGIVSSLFSNLASESPARVRLLAKFVERNYEKVDKLLEIRDAALVKLSSTEIEIEAEKKEMQEAGEETSDEEEDMWYLRRLDGGLFTLQTVDYIVAWVAMEDDGIREHVQRMLGRRSKSLNDIVRTLQTYHDNVDQTAEVDGPISRRDVLKNLIRFLEGC